MRDIQAARLEDGAGRRRSPCTPTAGASTPARSTARPSLRAATTWPSRGSPPRTSRACGWRSRRTAAARSRRRSKSRSGEVVGRVDVVLLARRARRGQLARGTAGGAAIRAQPFTAHGAGRARRRRRDAPTSRARRASRRWSRSADGLLFAWTETGADPGRPHGVRAACADRHARSRRRGRCASISAPFFHATQIHRSQVMSTAVKLDVPPQGQKITIANGKLAVPDQPDHPVHRRRRHRSRHLARLACACSTPRSRRPTAASARSTGWRSTPARRPTTCSTPGCPTRPSRPAASTWSSIKGPLTTPIGGGIRSLNVALRQMLDLYVCLRPVRWFKGVPSPVKAPGARSTW